MQNKVWFITGISSGLGKALAQVVIESGDHVIGTFRKKEQVEAFNLKHGKNGTGIQLDISNMAAIERQVEFVRSTFGKIDVLVNNAGVGIAGAIEETSLEETRQVFEVNFFGTLKLTQAILPLMREQGKGHIIQVSSHAGVKAFAGFGIYNASKFALEGFSEALAQEVKPLGITVTIVEPGPFRTSFAGRSLLLAQNIIEDYQDTAGAFRNKLLSVHDKQEGDPIKAAHIIYDYTQAENQPLRLALGTIPLKTIKMKIDSLTDDLKQNETLSKKAVY